MRGKGPNLASRPFANERPVRRTTALIWILAVGLLLLNVFIYQRHLSGQHEQRRASEEMQQRIAADSEAIARLESELAALDLEQQNERVEFLNSQIAKRTFSWGRLFDRLEEVLPASVQLQSVSPRAVDPRRLEARLGPRAADLVSLDLRGTAASDEALLELVDNLFQHSMFLFPNLSGEEQSEGQGLRFNIQVLYLPIGVPVAEPEPASVEEGP